MNRATDVGFFIALYSLLSNTGLSCTKNRVSMNILHKKIFLQKLARTSPKSMATQLRSRVQLWLSIYPYQTERATANIPHLFALAQPKAPLSVSWEPEFCD
jgi:hypothetical protein